MTDRNNLPGGKSKYSAPEALFALDEPGTQLPVEFDDGGKSSGVESEDIGERIASPFDPSKIEVQTRTPTVSLLINRIRRDTIDLAPDFQRRAGIWTAQAQSRLIESLLLRITLPTLYAAEVDEESWAIVDGVQRLTTIARFVDAAAIGAEPLVLTGLEYLTEFNGCSFADLPGRLQTRIEETELVVLLIRRGTPEEVKFNIFARINTGGRPLTRQELRHALIPGRARTFLYELANTRPFLSATSYSVSPERMSDREMCLRFLAFSLNSPDSYASQDFDGFLRSAMHTINTLSPEELSDLEGRFLHAMSAAERIFGIHAFRKRFPGYNRRSPVNKALFETESACLANRTRAEIDALAARQSVVEKKFMELMDDPTFVGAVSAGTGDVGKVRLRFREMDRIFQETLDA
ncbi:hypothetical protein GCM10010502_67640 [Kitasatospora aureofaciens]|uniref:GmrSD restriction endonucleases N-terminal domain-containing protein n=2 Tax=Kitasatospora aureofaciens TaxID=1894 RepID=A0A8H9HZU5_KITAU|nr:hypothetical protein B6264_22280 [Kitasatospora aureofaciens]GGV03470.1 hypothetical protein GCM10010502_67640 [Kitasatospora aureofaciens]